MRYLFTLLAAFAAFVCGAATPTVTWDFASKDLLHAFHYNNTYLRNQGFEGTGYDNSETWTTANGSPNADYTTTVLYGSQSLFLNTSGTSCRVRSDFANQDEVWFTALFRAAGSAPGGDRNIISFSENGGSTLRFQVAVTSASKLKVIAGSASATTTDAISYGTTYYLTIRARKGSGSDALISVGFSTTATPPGSGSKYAEVTTGTITNQIGRVWLGHSSSCTFDQIFDAVCADVPSDNPISLDQVDQYWDPSATPYSMRTVYYKTPILNSLNGLQLAYTLDTLDVGSLTSVSEVASEFFDNDGWTTVVPIGHETSVAGAEPTIPIDLYCPGSGYIESCSFSDVAATNNIAVGTYSRDSVTKLRLKLTGDGASHSFDLQVYGYPVTDAWGCESEDNSANMVNNGANWSIDGYACTDQYPVNGIHVGKKTFSQTANGTWHTYTVTLSGQHNFHYAINLTNLN